MHSSNPRLAAPRQVCYSHVWAPPWTDVAGLVQRLQLNTILLHHPRHGHLRFGGVFLLASNANHDCAPNMQVRPTWTAEAEAEAEAGAGVEAEAEAEAEVEAEAEAEVEAGPTEGLGGGFGALAGAPPFVAGRVSFSIRLDISSLGLAKRAASEGVVPKPKGPEPS